MHLRPISWFIFVSALWSAWSQALRYILWIMIVHSSQAGRRYVWEFKESAPRVHRPRLIINFVDSLPIVDLWRKAIPWSICRNVLESCFQKFSSLRIFDVGHSLFLDAQIRSHFNVSLLRSILVETNQMSKHLVVEANQFSVLIDFFIQFQLFCAPALVGLRVVVDGKNMHGGGVQLIDIERPKLPICNDCLRDQRIGEVVVR